MEVYTPFVCSDVNDGSLGSREWFQSRHGKPIALARAVQLTMCGCVFHDTMRAERVKIVVSTKNIWKTSVISELRNRAMSSCGTVIMKIWEHHLPWSATESMDLSYYVRKSFVMETRI